MELKAHQFATDGPARLCDATQLLVCGPWLPVKMHPQEEMPKEPGSWGIGPWGFQTGKEKGKRQQVFSKCIEHLEHFHSCVFYLTVISVIGHKYYFPDRTDKETEAWKF